MAKGLVHPVAPGNTSITVTHPTLGTIHVPVLIAAAAQVLDHLTLGISSGSVVENGTPPTLTLGAWQTADQSTPYTDTLSPAPAYSGDNGAVATINATTGAIALMGPGSVTFTVTAGGKSASVGLTVSAVGADQTVPQTGDLMLFDMTAGAPNDMQTATDGTSFLSKFAAPGASLTDSGYTLRFLTDLYGDGSNKRAVGFDTAGWAATTLTQAVTPISTTLNQAITSTGSAQSVLVGSTAGITAGMEIRIGYDQVAVASVDDATHLSAIFGANHASGDTVYVQQVVTLVQRPVDIMKALAAPPRVFGFGWGTANVEAVRCSAISADSLSVTGVFTKSHANGDAVAVGQDSGIGQLTLPMQNAATSKYPRHVFVQFVEHLGGLASDPSAKNPGSFIYFNGYVGDYTNSPLVPDASNHVFVQAGGVGTAGHKMALAEHYGVDTDHYSRNDVLLNGGSGTFGGFAMQLFTQNSRGASGQHVAGDTTNPQVDWLNKDIRHTYELISESSYLAGDGGFRWWIEDLTAGTPPKLVADFNATTQGYPFYTTPDGFIKLRDHVVFNSPQQPETLYQWDFKAWERPTTDVPLMPSSIKKLSDTAGLVDLEVTIPAGTDQLQFYTAPNDGNGNIATFDLLPAAIGPLFNIAPSDIGTPKRFTIPIGRATTLTAAVTGSSVAQTVPVASTAGWATRCGLIVDAEKVFVSVVDATHVNGIFRSSHSSGAAVVHYDLLSVSAGKSGNFCGIRPGVVETNPITAPFALQNFAETTYLRINSTQTVTFVGDSFTSTCSPQFAPATGITVSNVVVVDSGHIQATVALSGSATIGSISVTIRDSATSISTNAVPLTVVSDTPIVFPLTSTRYIGSNYSEATSDANVQSSYAVSGKTGVTLATTDPLFAKGLLLTGNKTISRTTSLGGARQGDVYLRRIDRLVNYTPTKSGNDHPFMGIWTTSAPAHRAYTNTKGNTLQIVGDTMTRKDALLEPLLSELCDGSYVISIVGVFTSTGTPTVTVWQYRFGAPFPAPAVSQAGSSAWAETTIQYLNDMIGCAYLGGDGSELWYNFGWEVVPASDGAGGFIDPATLGTF